MGSPVLCLTECDTFLIFAPGNKNDAARVLEVGFVRQFFSEGPVRVQGV